MKSLEAKVLTLTPEHLTLMYQFLVQPLVENAIKYGMQTSKQPLMISSRLEGEHLVIEVANLARKVERWQTLYEQRRGTLAKQRTRASS